MEVLPIEVVVGDIVRLTDVAHVTIRVENPSGEPVGLLTLRYASRIEAPATGWLLGLVSRLLPRASRIRFMAEVLGDLATCTKCRQRLVYLMGLVIGVPGLAWMMWRENRRGQA
jgi:hypothetical protein